ncbi:hypothetical protein A3J77_02240 [Candidatus Wolfebacteria bacterium RBG_13_41_7]|uniref:Prepilin-type N-terminal cleavage/methylation domain-containing protein n=1 Tax=Candidatus Wolfebacteria bacterium RBG_13_41_7 TaxID=1802554 RepID=A0A1F8DL52_9BACT|nr:MAG: hypothetical protein A3J77_02240 [Candidatus Wolfebacteria bacterium RBG_13_41_7]
MKLPKTLDSRGFTIIELLIAMTIFVALGALGLFIGIDFYKSHGFNSERNLIISVLQKARNQSLTNINEVKHGVYLKNNEYIIFQGENYLSRDTVYDEVIKANQAITRGGLEEVVFEQLTGNPNITGNITMTNETRSSIISIQNEGRINW